MQIHKIPFDKVKQHIEAIFSIAPAQRWELLPDSIHQLAKSAGIELQWTKIDWWSSFESGNFDVDNEAFLKALFKDIKPTDQETIIVTDECFKDKQAYYIKASDILTFIEDIYPEIHQMEFFQPHDFIFIFPTQKMITILHHEGAVMQFQAD